MGGAIAGVTRHPRKPSFQQQKESLTWTFIDKNGKMTRRELDKHVIEDVGMWLTIMYTYQDFRPRTEKYDPPKIAFVRYRKYRGSNKYQRMSNFNVSIEQAKAMASPLMSWAAFAHAKAAQAEYDFDGPDGYAPTVDEGQKDHRTTSALEANPVLAP